MSCCTVCEDVIFMFDTGESAPEVVRRMGLHVTTIDKRLKKHDHREYAARLERPDSAERAEARRRQRAAKRVNA